MFLEKSLETSWDISFCFAFQMNQERGQQTKLQRFTENQEGQQVRPKKGFDPLAQDKEKFCCL